MNKNLFIRFLLCAMIFSLSFAFVSCGNVRLIKVVGYNNDFGELTEEQKTLVCNLVSFDSTELGKVYKVNPVQLKSELCNHAKSLVYVFSRSCNSMVCKPLSYYEQYAAKNGYVLFLVIRNYISMPDALAQQPNCPLFVIDDDYFNEHRRFIYERYFTNEMMGLPRKIKYKDIPKNRQGDLLFFECGRLIKVSEEIEE